MTFTEQFPVLNQCTYLNTANSGILSKTLFDWRRENDLEFMASGSRFRLKQQDFLLTVKENVSRYFHAKAKNTFLVPNFSFGFNVFLDGLPANTHFLLLREDYPSVNYAVECRGFKCSYLPISQNLENDILEQLTINEPNVLAISLVQYISGIRIDLNFLKEIKKQFPNLLIVADGTQFCGTERFDFESSGLDVLISSGYKWMLSGYGNGFVFIKETIKNRLYQDRQSRNLPAEPFLKDIKPLNLCFEPGHQDTIAFGSLSQSVLYLETLGSDLIESRIRKLSTRAKAEFTSRGLLAAEVTGREKHSSIFNLKANPGLYEKLEQANIVVSARGQGIRISFHFYNTDEELNHLLEVIDNEINPL